MSFRSLSGFCILATLLFASGCGSKADKATGKGKKAAPAAPDDAAAITALTDAGFKVKKSAAGNVEEASMGSEEDISEVLSKLVGMPSVRKLTFTGPGISDAGMENPCQRR